MKAPLPPSETLRLEALHEYKILDSLPEEAYDDLAHLAAYICRTPIALISFIDEKRQWFKSRVGVDQEETDRDLAFCAHAILGKDPLVVPDATLDPRFAYNPLVTSEPKIRFYAGAPLVTPEGHKLGTLCVLDHTSRQLSPEQLDALRALSRQVVALLELRLAAARLEHFLVDRKAGEEQQAQEVLHTWQLTHRMQLIFESIQQGIYAVDSRGRCVFMNRAASGMLGYRPVEIEGKDAHELLHDSAGPVSQCPICRVFQTRKGCHVDAGVFRHKDGTGLTVEYDAHPIIERGTLWGIAVSFVRGADPKKAK